ncbi:FAD-dependent oxidoreductase [Paraburkholderia caribensis]|uniref:FAD-dependent oxidoreductase n=1 Tax=Paraburkholderia caribensis TaxID=75105 RepID=UPI001CAE8A6B|nr:FAD-dependent oxidoreductase [Paraburkholderia caribensis]CAG9242142.1 FAD binding domain protein [Paraburkholderia caribensis]
MSKQDLFLSEVGSTTDLVIVGSGAAALVAALVAAAKGKTVAILEKSAYLGGTSAMSGAGIWIPGNHIARRAGLIDSPEEALKYIRNVAPQGWEETEDSLWKSFVEYAPTMLKFLEENTPLRFELTQEPDTKAEQPGGRKVGRMVSPLALSRRVAGPYSCLIRRSTLPHLFTYGELLKHNPYQAPISTGIRLLPRLIYRLMTNGAGQGSALIAGLIAGCLKHGCKFYVETAAVKLIQHTNGVDGVEAVADGRQLKFMAKHGVLLATGGFEWNTNLLATHFPGVDMLGSPSTNTGDGQRMAQEAGAELDRMNQANIYPSLPVIYEGRKQALPLTFQAEPHSIIVNGRGERFVSEYDFNFGEALDQRDASGQPVNLPAWIVGDRRLMKNAFVLRWLTRHFRGWIKSESTISDLARSIGISGRSLENTIARYNQFCRLGNDEDFGRGSTVWERYMADADGHSGNPTLGAIERGPYYAIPLYRCILGTKGGARTNEKAQVLRPDGSVIRGLYAAGLAMANPIGTRAVGPGTTIGPNMTWGYIAATTMIDISH